MPWPAPPRRRPRLLRLVSSPVSPAAPMARCRACGCLRAGTLDERLIDPPPGDPLLPKLMERPADAPYPDLGSYTAAQYASQRTVPSDACARSLSTLGRGSHGCRRRADISVHRPGVSAPRLGVRSAWPGRQCAADQPVVARDGARIHSRLHRRHHPGDRQSPPRLVRHRLPGFAAHPPTPRRRRGFSTSWTGQTTSSRTACAPAQQNWFRCPRCWS